MNNKQVTMPRYRENHLTIPFSMLCPGISQNTKHHQLSLYKGQVTGDRSYPEVCGNNILNIVYHPDTIDFYHYQDFVYHDTLDLENIRVAQHMNSDFIEKNGELYVPPVPGKAFTDGRANGLGFNDRYTQIPYESEILQSFVSLTASTYITLQKWEAEKDTKQGGVEYQIKVGNWRCTYRTAHKEQCASLKQYDVWYIWTKEGFKIKTFF